MRKTKNDFELGELLELWKNSGFMKPKVVAKDIEENWELVVGESIAKQTSRMSISQGTLFLKIISPLWRKELQYNRESLKKSINDYAGYELIQNIEIH